MGFPRAPEYLIFAHSVHENQLHLHMNNSLCDPMFSFKDTEVRRFPGFHNAGATWIDDGSNKGFFLLSRATVGSRALVTSKSLERTLQMSNQMAWATGRPHQICRLIPSVVQPKAVFFFKKIKHAQLCFDAPGGYLGHLNVNLNWASY